MSSIVPPFSGKKYQTTVTIVVSGESFAFPYMILYTHMRSNQWPDWYHLIHYAMTQISMKAGMKIFGTRGVNAVQNDLKHFHLCNKFEPLYPHTLIKEGYDEVLESHLFIKYNRDKISKRIMVDGDNKKCITIDKGFTHPQQQRLSHCF